MDPSAAQTRRPQDTNFKQQRLKAWQPILTPIRVISIFLVIAIIFVPVGITLLIESDSIVEYTYQYDGSGSVNEKCKISDSKLNTTCTITVTLEEDMSSPIWVYYQLTNFYQNHRRYVKSRSSDQLLGDNLGASSVSSDCDPLYKLDGKVLNPCGLIANSLFSDVISLNLTDNPSNLTMKTTGISWSSDREDKFAQVTGFKKKECTNYTTCTCSLLGTSSKYANCKNTTDSDGNLWVYWYPDSDTVTYLYERYPNVVSPLEGVTNEHFIVWMRTAGLPNFRKPYGKIEKDLKKGQELNFTIYADFLVADFDGSKTIIISEIGDYGGKNPFLGVAYIVIGVVCFVLALAFGVKHYFFPRKLGDVESLRRKD